MKLFGRFSILVAAFTLTGMSAVALAKNPASDGSRATVQEIPSGASTAGASVLAFCIDQDGDHWFQASPPGTCTTPGPPPMGFLGEGDCNDNDVSINPGATEVCNGIDDDCDGPVDEGVTFTYYPDNDQDAFGDPLTPLVTCAAMPPIGFTTENTDCDDTEATVFPGATELCDNLDNDCGGTIDGFATSCGVGACSSSGTCTAGVDSCMIGSAVAEVCANALDDDCDGSTDENGTRYVDDAMGASDGVNDCLTLASPCATIQHAIDVACTAETVSVQAGTYTQLVTVNKPVSVSGAGPSSVVMAPAGGSPAAGQKIFTVAATNVTIEGLQIDVDRGAVANAAFGIYGDDATGSASDDFVGLLVQNTVIRNIGTGARATTNADPSLRAAGIVLVSNQATYPVVTVRANTIGSGDAANFFQRGIWLRDVRPLIGGPAPADGNDVRASGFQDLLFRFGPPSGGASVIQNNIFRGPGVDLSEPNNSVEIRNNQFMPAAITNEQLLSIKRHTNAGQITVDGNAFTGHPNIGVIVGASKDVFITNNTFTPGAPLGPFTSFTHVLVSTAYPTGGPVPGNLVNTITIQGNTFNNAAGATGRAIDFQNGESATSSFGPVVVGGAGALENIFDGSLSQYIRLNYPDPSYGALRFQPPTFVDNPAPSSAPANVNIDASGNTFGGLLPAAMTLAQLYDLEDRIQHTIDATPLGLVRVVAGNVYVTLASFVTPPTTVGSIQRGVDAASVADTVNVKAGGYTENVNVNKRVTVDGAGIGATVVTGASPVFTVSGTGLDASNRLTIQNLTATGGTVGVVITNAAGSHYTFDTIEAMNNSVAGIQAGTSGTVSDVEVTNCSLHDNGIYGLFVPANVMTSFSGLTVTGGSMDNNHENGFAVYGSNTSTNATGIDVTGTTFTNNGMGGSLGRGSVLLYQFNGDATLSGIAITGVAGSDRNCLQMRGRGTYPGSVAPAGTVMLTDVSIAGACDFSAIEMHTYSAVAGISMSGVNLTATSPWGLFIEELGLALHGVTLDVGDTLFNGTNSTNLTLGDISLADIDATGATFGGVLASTACSGIPGTLGQLFTIEDRVGHSIDAPGGGRVFVCPNRWFVTPNSFGPPLTTFARVQRGVDTASAADTVHVQSGTYTEQVDIAKALHVIGEAKASTIIQAPGVLVNDPLFGQTAIVTMRGAAVPIELLEMTIAGPGPGGCGSLHYGILVKDGAIANIHDTIVEDIRDNPLSGCQNGIAIRAGAQFFATTGSATLVDNDLVGYQKGGVVLDGTGTTGIVTNNRVWGAGPTPLIAQNGIQISRGATATLGMNDVKDHQCDHPTACGSDPLTFSQSTGIALVFAGATTISQNVIHANDVGLYNFAPGVTSGFDHNMLTDNRYEGVVLDEGTAQIEDNTLTGGNIGVAVISFSAADGVAGDSVGTLLRNTIHGATEGIALFDTDTGNPYVPVLTATHNDISGNAAGVNNTTTTTANANCNWWGASDGPGPVGPGSGDTITNFVDAGFWLLANDFGADTDMDTYSSCTSPGNGDCNNLDAMIHPGATETCNGVDQDCNGTIDDGGDMLCQDGVFCNGLDTCHGVMGCMHAGDPCPDGSTCTTDTCDEMSASCLYDNSNVCALSGTISYYVGPQKVPGQDVDYASDVDMQPAATTDGTGEYSFVPGGAGNVTLTPASRLVTSENECDAAITGTDAALCAQHAVMLITLSANQQIAGDVTNNGEVTAFDASLIAQKAAGVCAALVFPVETARSSNWEFVPASLDYTPINASVTDADFLGVLYGDVTGNWDPSIVLSLAEGGMVAGPDEAGSAERSSGPVSVVGSRVPRKRAAGTLLYVARGPLPTGDGHLEIVYGLMNSDGIQGLDVTLSYDPGAVNVRSVQTAGLASSFTLVRNDTGGRLVMALYGTAPMQGTNDFLVVTYDETAPSSGQPFGVRAEANEGQIPILWAPDGLPWGGDPNGPSVDR